MRFVTAMAAIAVAALSPVFGQEGTVSVADQNAREVTLAGVPQRVICLLNRCAEELAFVGAPVPVGFGAPYTYNVALNPANFGAMAVDSAQISQTDGVDFEAIAALSPDLVIGEVDHVAALAEIAPVYTLNWDAKTDVDAFLYDVRNYGLIFGIKEETDAKVQAVLDRVAAYAALSPKDRTIAVIFFEADGQSLWLPNDCGLFVSQATACARSEKGEWTQGGLEMLLSYDPDVLIVEDYGVGEAEILAAQESNPLWNELTAVRNGAVHLVPVSQARANTIASVESVFDTLMPLVYPQTFPAPLTDEQVAAAQAQE